MGHRDSDFGEDKESRLKQCTSNSVFNSTLEVHLCVED